MHFYIFTFLLSAKYLGDIALLYRDKDIIKSGLESGELREVSERSADLDELDQDKGQSAKQVPHSNSVQKKKDVSRFHSKLHTKPHKRNKRKRWHKRGHKHKQRKR